MNKGYFTFVLHSHLPYVISHGSWPHGMDWLNEAAAETYIPLIECFRSVGTGSEPLGVTLGVTPILAEQLADERFKSSFVDYLDNKIAAAAGNKVEFERIGDGHKAYLAGFWDKFYRKARDMFTGELDGDLIGALRGLQDQGKIEIITCAATHGYLPLLSRDECVKAQLALGVSSYRRHFGVDPVGTWLPECAYRPAYDWVSPIADEGYGPAKPVRRMGVEQVLNKVGLKYFIVDSHLLTGGRAIGVYLDRFEALKKLWKQFEGSYKERPEDEEYTPYLPYLAGDPGHQDPVAFFTRDPKTGLQVWSGEHGYPGDGMYLDFHKKHFPGGHRYWRVTSSDADLADKQEYQPDRVPRIVGDQGRHYVDLIESLAGEYHAESDRAGMVTAPYDTELFGHWWFEGPEWLSEVLKGLHASETVEGCSCGRFIEKYPPATVVGLPEGSWGEGGFHYIWLNDWNKWTWKHIYQAEEKMCEVALGLSRGGGGDGSESLHRVACQLGRELLLLESSDWQFLISTWSARDYAEARVVKHWDNFERLARMFDSIESESRAPDADWQFLEL
ncbi:MAG: 1,4-alpha-glucan branching protein domain-containing protein, partial [Gemmatimonadota bacterium]|nr:1,4-alpha-glucan branching protein domain-containing protein [Gemmatimonadota bacterium]